MKGQSGNPAGRRKGSVSPTAALKRALTRADAELIARKLITLAKQGDPAALKILLDRCDGPLNGPLAIATATAQAASEANPQGITSQVIIMDNHRGDGDRKPFDHAGYVQMSRQLFGVPTGDAPPPPATAPVTPNSEAPASESEPEGNEAEQCPGVLTGSEFLKAD
jgi:hypothetical protein